MFCTNCGKELYPGDKFCAHCGNKVRLGEAAPKLRQDVVFNPPFRVEAEKRTSEIFRGFEEVAERRPRQTEPADFDWNLDGFPKAEGRRTEEIDFNWDSVVERRNEKRATEDMPAIPVVDKIDLSGRAKKTEPVDFDWGDLVRRPKQKEEEPVPVKEEKVEELAQVVEEPKKEEAPMSVEELERELFGENYRPLRDSELSQTGKHEKSRAKLEKFFTYNEKNEAFQELLDKEYERLKGMEEERKPDAESLEYTWARKLFPVVEEAAEEGVVAEILAEEEKDVPAETEPAEEVLAEEHIEPKEKKEEISTDTIDFSPIREEARKQKKVEPEKLDAPRIEGDVSPLSGMPKLTWDKVEGATRYKIYRAREESGEFVYMYSVANTKYVNTSAKVGQTYYYKVMAVNEQGKYIDSEYSETVAILCTEAPVVANEKTHKLEEKTEESKAVVSAMEDPVVAIVEEGTETQSEEITPAEMEVEAATEEADVDAEMASSAETEVEIKVEKETKPEAEQEAVPPSNGTETESKEDGKEVDESETEEEHIKKTKLRYSDVFPKEIIVDDSDDGTASCTSDKAKALPELIDLEDDEEEEPKKTGFLVKLVIAVLILLLLLEGVIFLTKLIAPDSKLSVTANTVVETIMAKLSGEDPNNEETSNLGVGTYIKDILETKVELPDTIGKVTEDVELVYDLEKDYAFSGIASSKEFTNSIWKTNDNGEEVSYGEGVLSAIVSYYGKWQATNTDTNLIGINKLEIGEIRTGGEGYFVLCRLTFAAADGEELVKYETAYVKISQNSMIINEIKEETI